MDAWVHIKKGRKLQSLENIVAKMCRFGSTESEDDY